MPDDMPKVCQRCNWQCCNTYPGVAHPDDFPASADLVEALVSGRWAVDEYVELYKNTEVKKRTMFVRAAVRGHEGLILHNATEGCCTFLTEDGCMLDGLQRPLMCRKIQPDPSKIGECTMPYKVKDMARSWASYQDGIRSAVAQAKQQTNLRRLPACK